MGLRRKTLLVATGGLSGLVFKEEPKKKPRAKAAEKEMRPKKRTKAKRPKPHAARRPTPQAARRPKPKATRRPEPKAARRPELRAAERPTPLPAGMSTAAQTAGAGNGTASELERLSNLHGRGALTGDEFAAAKAKILGTSPPHASSRGPATFPNVEAKVAAARHLAELAAHDDGPSVAIASSD
jgi:hypothetical protein